MDYLISIVIAARNSEKTIAPCLESLFDLDFPKESFEILVVDNNSKDKTREIIKKFPARYAFEVKIGRASALNRGIKDTCGKFIAFIGSDCIADRNWLKHLIKGFTGEEIAGCGGEQFACKPNNWIERYTCKEFCHRQKRGLIDRPIYFPRIANFNAIYRRKVVEAVNLFDENFFINESLDLSWRIFLKGYQLKYVPKAIVYHKPITSLRVFFQYWFENGATVSYLERKFSAVLEKPAMDFSLVNVTSIINYCLQNLNSFYLRINKSFSFADCFLSVVKYSANLLGCLLGVVRINLGVTRIVNFSKPENNIFWRQVSKHAVVTNVHSKTSYHLNEVGSMMWSLKKKGKSSSEILDAITKEYDIDKEEARVDLERFVKEAEKEELLITK